jgi:hypothetical protein
MSERRPAAQSPSGTSSASAWYSYAVVRVVPRPEREEFVNAGVILFAPERRFLGAAIELDAERVRALAPEVDVSQIERHLGVFQAVADGRAEGGAIAALPQQDRFHWLTAPRSTVIQTSAVHTGRCADPRAALEELLVELVRPPAG